MRYASMMPLGSVILKVASTTKADSMWYFPLLRPFDWKAAAQNDGAATPGPVVGDHLPIAADLSDLGDAILWAKRNDATCATIAQNAKALYGRLIASDGQLDYMQLMLHEIARRFVSRADLSRASAVAREAALAAVGGLSLSTSAKALAHAAASVAIAAGSAPSLLAPEISSPPGGIDDWFGECNLGYASQGLGPMSRPAMPIVRDLASTSCQCVRCNEQRASISALRAAADAANAVSAAATAQTSLATRVAIDRHNAALSARAAPAADVFKDKEKARAAAARAAEAARLRKGAAASADAGAGAGSGSR